MWALEGFCDCLRHVFDVLAGYTVSSVIVGDWKRLYVAGAPRFKHKGKVILFELSDDGDVNIAQALNGEQVICACARVCVFRDFSPFQKLSVCGSGGQNRDIVFV